MASEHKIGPQPGPERAFLDFLSIFQTFWAKWFKKIGLSEYLWVFVAFESDNLVHSKEIREKKVFF